MNVEAAEVERQLGRTIMPRFHAGWSFGAFAGAAIGIPMAAIHAPLVLHVAGFAVLAAVAAGAPRGVVPPGAGGARQARRRLAGRRGRSRARWPSASW